MRLLGLEVLSGSTHHRPHCTTSQPLNRSVLANNDAPTGAARIVLEATLPSDWEGWSGGSGSSKRSAAAEPARRVLKLAKVGGWPG